jgi:hypothetical protein
MQEVLTIAPAQHDPGLVAYECPSCAYVTSRGKFAEMIEGGTIWPVAKHTRGLPNGRRPRSDGANFFHRPNFGTIFQRRSFTQLH